MSELLKIILSLSLSGTLLFFIILVLKPLYKNRLSKRWQYYVWLIVVVRMLLPFTPETTLVGSAFAYLDNINVGTIQTPIPANNGQSDFGSDEKYIMPSAEPQAPKSTIDTAPSLSIQTIFLKVYENLWILWATIAFALLIRKITMYQSFVRFVKAGRTEVSDIEILNTLADIGETVGVKKPVELFVNPLISSPMLLGFFRPYIILPSIELNGTELAHIMRHELTHYKHLDMFYKWFVQITVCLHWFNPFVYLMAKEINKCCELSCDEAIIRTLDKDEKKAYGDTLLNSLNAIGHYNDKLAAVTLTECAEQLKERLDAIMKFKKKSKVAIAITLVLTAMLCIGATTIGAYAAPTVNKDNVNDTLLTNSKVIREGGVYYILCDGADESDKPISGVTEGSVSLVLVRKDGYTSISGFNDIEKLVDEVEEQCEYLLKKQSITQDEASLIIKVATKIQSGEDSYFTDQKMDTPWSAMGGTGEPYTYYQSGYYQGSYIFELGWNLNEKGYNAYVDKAELKLSDRTTITVSFDKSCNIEAQDNAILADLEELVDRLKKQYANSSTPLEKPLVVSVQYVGDNDLVKLAEEYYTNDELTSFSAIFSSLDITTQKEYCTKMIADEKNAFLSSTAKSMELDMIDFCLEKTYQEGKIALFTGIVPCLTDDMKETWATRASHDKKNTFLAVLTR